MVFSKEHKALIKSLYELKCCNARQFMMEYRSIPKQAEGSVASTVVAEVEK